ncbi:hypothetical protein [Photorhabdus sp. RW14-46]|uniref:hypothetical protein n=1 Tax=Photorhabdus sp. RW14-46 TaxID=2100168 RepID=UPI0013F4B7C4|nr:hypothetical protein [Photorhabdus sp. RW14-46]NHB60027.1 hypothetical protein [Photorhabdus sp. RW14-46]
MDNDLNNFMNACREFRENIIILDKNNLKVENVDNGNQELVNITNNLQNLIEREAPKINNLLSEFSGEIKIHSESVNNEMLELQKDINNSSININKLRMSSGQLVTHINLVNGRLKYFKENDSIENKSGSLRDNINGYKNNISRIYNPLKNKLKKDKNNMDAIDEIKDLYNQKNNVLHGLLSVIFRDNTETPSSIEDIIKKMEFGKRKFNEEEILPVDWGFWGFVIGLSGLIFVIGIMISDKIEKYNDYSNKIILKEKSLIDSNLELLIAYKLYHSTKGLSDACEGIRYHYANVINQLIIKNNELLELAKKIKQYLDGNDWNKNMDKCKSLLEQFKEKSTRAATVNFTTLLYCIINSKLKN